MQLARDDVDQIIAEPELYDTLLSLDDTDIVELGCGSAAHTRIIASGGQKRRVIAFEVDRVQLERNLAVTDLANVSFRYGGAEATGLPDASADVVFMFKSLHHVPGDLLDQAMTEVARILRPGGHAWISEPVFAGAFNDIIRIFHDEQAVRQAAFDALCRAVDSSMFELEQEIFFLNPVRFADFAEFEQRIIRATHTDHSLDEFTFNRVRQLFAAHVGTDGARFDVPMRVDLLRKPLVR